MLHTRQVAVVHAVFALFVGFFPSLLHAPHADAQPSAPSGGSAANDTNDAAIAPRSDGKKNPKIAAKKAPEPRPKTASNDADSPADETTENDTTAETGTDSTDPSQADYAEKPVENDEDSATMEPSDPVAPIEGPTGVAAQSNMSMGVTADSSALQISPSTATTPATRPVREPESENANDVFAEDWWHTARPILELHGYFRTRAELFHNLSLGRSDPHNRALWPRPADDSYTSWYDGQVLQNRVLACSDNPADARVCKDKTQAGANLRFRLNPELHISDNVRIMSQIDMLDNLVLGSTPNGYANEPAAAGAYARVTPSGYTPLGVYNETMVPPTAGQNSFKNSIVVKHVWGEYATPIGQLRFGRMPSHWGLGMLENDGSGFDANTQSTVDRIMFTTGVKSIDLYISAAWDFAGEGPTSETSLNQQGQPYDLAQLDDVNQYVLSVLRQKPLALQRLSLSRGDVVFNGGLLFTFRHQSIANDAYNTAGAYTIGTGTADLQQGYVRRNAKIGIPDLWAQLLYKSFRFELEAAMVLGSVANTEVAGSNYENLNDPDNKGHKIRKFGLATQTEYRTVEDRLSLQFGFGWASGDPDVQGPLVGGINPGSSGLQQQRTSNRTDSTFRFHPAYSIDLILHRYILQRVQGTYYFRPSVDYDFSRSANGQRIGGGVAVLWTRASEFMQTPGHKRDLGIEIDAQLYFQSKDGALNDDPSKKGGFFTMLQYGVLFPLGGLGYLPGEKTLAENQGIKLDTSAAHTLRWYGGIFF